MTAPARRCWSFAALAMVSALAACGESDKVIEIDMADLAFSPADVQARVGDTIEWVNKDLFDHTATTADIDVVIVAGAKEKMALKQAGEIDYICRFHPDMKGRIVVAPR